MTLATPELVAAIVLSAVFGAALIWLLAHYLHNYIHVRCIELAGWLHDVLILVGRESSMRSGDEERGDSDTQRNGRRATRRRARTIDGQEVQARSSKRKREKHKRSRSSRTDMWGVKKSRDKAKGWRACMGEVNEEGCYGRPHDVEQGIQGFNMMDPRAYDPPSPFLLRYGSKLSIYRSPSHGHVAAATLAGGCGRSIEQAHMLPASHEDPDFWTESGISPRVFSPMRTDYIHVCDQYPDIILERLQQQAPLDGTSISSHSCPSADGSSDGSRSIEEIPRDSMPEASRHASLGFPTFPAASYNASQWDAMRRLPLDW